MAYAPSRNSATPTSKVARSSQSQPEHRRPSWAKKESTYRAYISNANSRPRAPGDFGLDNFSYDETYVREWQLPSGLSKHLSQELRDAAHSWVLAGAAVCTALERIQKMDNEAVDRTDPATTHEHLLKRRVSDQTPAVVGAETPATSSPAAPTCSKPNFVVSCTKSPLIQPFPQLPVNMAGLESPPFTPVDSKVPNTPACEPLFGPNGTAPDLDSVTAQLYPLSSRSSLTMSSLDTAVKNEQAWEYYVGAFNAEVEDLRTKAFTRLKGYTRTIDRICTELGWDRDLSTMEKAALGRFVQWWKVMKPKVSRYQDKVDALQEKVVGTKTELEAMESKACGLPF